jgi:hypothetical protein
MDVSLRQHEYKSICRSEAHGMCPVNFLRKLRGLRGNFAGIITYTGFPNLYIEQSTAFSLTQEEIIVNRQQFPEYGEQLPKSLVDNKKK